MLNQTLESIIVAETKAEKLINDALNEAKAMSTNATIEAEKIKIDTVRNVKEERGRVTETATKEAEENYENIISLGKDAAEKLIRESDTTQVVKIIKAKVLSKYGNN